jgi:ketosteroid isomerase-like protein
MNPVLLPLRPRRLARVERRRALLGLAGLTLTLAGIPAAGATEPDLPALAREVEATERAFARSMAERDHAAFTALLSEQAVFFGGKEPLRGKAAVAEGWKAFFDDPQAPFSWAPDHVEVLSDGTLALSTGPVLNPAGQPIARFNSIWRREAPGVWRVVFDKGQPPDPPKPKP